MRVFVTGASGFIGLAVTHELVSSGHEVIGLARSDKSADAIIKAGATPLRASLDDIDSLKKGVDESDGVINLAFNHDFSQFATSAQAELKASETIGQVLKGTNRPFVIASGGPVIDEKIPFPPDTKTPASLRTASALAALELSKHNVRSSVVRLAPSVHDGTRRGFVGTLVDIAQKTGVSGYVGDGSNRWCAVHRLDAAHLFCLALEKAPAGSILQGVADEGIPVKEIAEKIGGHLDALVVSIPSDKAGEHFGWLRTVIGADIPASSIITQELLGWKPTHPGLLDDLDHGHFFDIVPVQ